MSRLISQLAVIIVIAAAVAQGGCCRSRCMQGDACLQGDGCMQGDACLGDTCEGCGSKCKKFGLPHLRSQSIPETYPLGSLVRSHYHTMETNGEAADFILYRREFVGATAELTPDGKDHILEIAARMRSTPFPVVVERSENNSDPELDAHRRYIVAQVLTDVGNPDAMQRTFVSPAYGPGKTGLESESEYYRNIYFGSTYQTGNNGSLFGQGGQSGAFVGGFGAVGFSP